MIGRRFEILCRLVVAWLAACALPGSTVCHAAAQPNVILMMADDLGWGDVGFNGGKIIKTPCLDAMAKNSLRFTRFYSAAPVCSPTRGSCMTGRHPYRYGIYFANVGHLRQRELALPELLGDMGYATGHFGKWHLGSLSPDYSGKGQRRNPKNNYATPGTSGFSEWFSTEYAVATWDPYDPANRHGKKFDVRNLYWHNGVNVTDELKGDDSRIIMDRAIPFIRDATKRKVPFLAVIWFHAPHSPVVGGPEYRAQYAQYDQNAQHYYACVTALDEQVGRLRAELRSLDIADQTLVWFCSDNGPARQGSKRHVGSPGPLRGFKTSLFEGGVRVPALWEWPEHVKAGQVTNFPAVTSDYLPTILDLLGVELPDKRPLDGISLLGLLDHSLQQRPTPICFQSGKQLAISDNRYKLFSRDQGKSWQLFDLLEDHREQRDIALAKPAEVERLKKQLEQWRRRCAASDRGDDYTSGKK